VRTVQFCWSSKRLCRGPKPHTVSSVNALTAPPASQQHTWDSCATVLPQMLAKRLLGKLKKKPKDEDKQQKLPQQRQTEDSEEYGSEYTDTDDERVHDFEIGQENYLLQVAIATSAQDYAHQSTNGIAAEAATPGAGELSQKYWRDGRCGAQRQADGLVPAWQPAHCHVACLGLVSSSMIKACRQTGAEAQAVASCRLFWQLGHCAACMPASSIPPCCRASATHSKPPYSGSNSFVRFPLAHGQSCSCASLAHYRPQQSLDARECVLCRLLLSSPSAAALAAAPPPRPPRLDYWDVICDGFYDVEGDFPEITDDPADFPSIAALRHVRCFEADPREVGGRVEEWRQTSAAAAAVGEGGMHWRHVHA
jgi:hypothetical protein